MPVRYGSAGDYHRMPRCDRNTLRGCSDGVPYQRWPQWSYSAAFPARRQDEHRHRSRRPTKIPLLTLPALQHFPATYEGLVLVNQRNFQQDFYSRPETNDEEHKLSCFKLLTRPVQKIQSVAQQGGSIRPLRGIFFYV